MKHISLFSGIGGFDLASEWMGWENIAHCEWNPFGQKILKHYWPEAISYEDITKTDFSEHRGKIDIVTGGFPCQPYSVAGKRKGKDDERHLWPEMLRAIREIQPRWVVGENVRGLVNWDGGLVFEEVQADLESEGYKILPFLLPASGVNAPHQRERIWFVAHSTGCSEGSSRTSRETESYRGDFNNEQESGGTSTELNNGCGELLRDSSDSDSVRFNGSERQYEVNSGETGIYAFCNIVQSDEHGPIAHTDSIRSEFRSTTSNWNEKGEAFGSDIFEQTDRFGSQRTITDPNSRRQSGEEYKEKKPRRTSEESISNYWENFPTQSPVCDGDDGLSARLDGITFPKWRNESIKAGGNAIVPQVAFQIFKAIQEYENLQDHG